MSLVGKFKKLEIKAKETLSNEDMSYCDRITREAEEVRVHLLEKYTYSKTNYDKESLGYTFGTYGYVNKPSGLYEDSFRRYYFTHIYEIKAIKDLLRGVESTYQSRIIDYFSSKYNITLSTNYKNKSELKFRDFGEGDTLEKELNTPFEYNEIIDWIKVETDGIDFVELGHREFKNSFRDWFKSYRGWNWTIKSGTLLVVDNFYSIYKRWTGNYEADSSKFAQIQDGFNFFETENLQDSKGIDRTLTTTMLHQYDFRVHEFENLTKIKSIKLFKNGRADIKFRDTKTLNDFLDFYQLREDLEND